MSTRAIISILDEGSRTLTSIGLSCDGYLSHAGKILLAHYNSEKRVKQLMKQGDLFALNPKILSKVPSIKKYRAMPITDELGRDNRVHEVFNGLRTYCIPFQYYANSIEPYPATKRTYPIQQDDTMCVLDQVRPLGEHHYIWWEGLWLVPHYNKHGNFDSWRRITPRMCVEN